MLDLEIKGSPLAIVPLSIKPPQASLCPLPSDQSPMFIPEASSRQLATMSYQPDQLPQQKIRCVADVNALASSDIRLRQRSVAIHGSTRRSRS